MEDAAPSPWQAPPHFLVARLLRDWLVGEPRWPLLVSDLRLVSRGWREAVADTLPVLAPSDSVARPAAAAAVVAAVASALPSLNLLQLSGVTQLGPVCAGCTALRALRLLDCHSPEQAEPAFPTTDELQQLSRLRQLRSLEIAAPGWQAKAQSLAPLAALSQLERLSIRCNAIISVSGLAALTGLMSLEVASFVVRPQWWNDLAAALPQQFPKLLHLGLEASEWFAGAALFRQAEAPLAPLALPPHLTSLALCLLMSAHDLGKLLGPVLAAEASDSRPARLRRLHLEVGDRAGPMVPPFLPLGALPGLEALTLRHQMLIPPPSQLCRLAPSLASLELDLHVLGPRHAILLLAMLGREMAGLQNLALLRARYTPELALASLSGLSRLTSLKVTGAHQFGGWALRSMQALTALQRLTLSETALHPDDLAAHRDARSDSDEEHTRPEQWRSAGLPPSLTCLQLWDNHSLSPDAVAREAVSLPRLRRLVLRGTPVLERRHLQLVLQQSASLRLLQTDWQPGEGAAACDWEADAAFCQEWRLRLQPRLRKIPIELEGYGRRLFAGDQSEIASHRQDPEPGEQLAAELAALEAAGG